MPATRTQKQTSRDTSSPRAAKEKKIPRPPNAWILYRKDTVARLKKEDSTVYSSMNQKLLSKIIGPMWHDAPAEVRREYKELAIVKLAEHMQMYPGYVYRPRTKAQKEALQKAKTIAAKEKRARAAEEKTAKAASRATSARAPRTRNAPSENDPPPPDPSQSAVSRRKLRTSAASTSEAVPSAPRTRQTQDTTVFPGMGVFSLVDSDADSRLSSATPELEYDGEVMQCLPFPLQPTATAFVPDVAPGSGFVQYTASGFPPAVEASCSVPQAVQGWSSQAPGGDLLPGFTMASPGLSSDFDPLGLSREWYGLPPRELDASFPDHLPIAGLTGPIDLEDAVFALNNAQSSGVAWMVPPPVMNVDTPNSITLSPLFMYEGSSASENDALASAIDASEAHYPIDASTVNAAADNLPPAFDGLLAEVLTYTEPSAHATSPDSESVSAEPQQYVWGDDVGSQRFQDTAGDFDKVDRLLAMIGVSVGPSL
ncbi:uncharacterized protein TRAVEDRAFT_67477 [Trametes versicolor FP-101664 SS1]|uniref:uncharacterized protein n=1 Tax=Trametes versicolor (strain FP-101664) TaxID=717944 RepID=UPI0004622048|nr:uncharacterized protein TRAVEDRAFT_67477 [Trametes versicolor FP-101664 SS1]EIW52457.1 hypothetical protein TRAVEDRAFT_67477 [Trametes versicolor FP-101664 SS1]